MYTRVYKQVVHVHSFCKQVVHVHSCLKIELMYRSSQVCENFVPQEDILIIMKSSIEQKSSIINNKGLKIQNIEIHLQCVVH